MNLNHKKIVITAGPTREAIDPVRYISNHSSGKMGYALAEAARDSGADVTLISGPTILKEPDGITIKQVISAEQMLTAVMHEITDCDIFIAAAAVADYRPQTIADQKIKKTNDALTLTLIKNPDILASVSALDSRPLCIGFAAETNDVITHAKQKLQNKKLDMIIANQVGAGLAFNQDDNQVTLLFPNRAEINLERQSKQKIAATIIETIAENF